jgi:hypothetical protein
MQTVPIPNVSPLPLPGPVWLFTALLLVVFLLHLLAMNAALGGGMWAVWNYLRGRHAGHEYSRRIAGELAGMLPVFLAFTITLGVAALLFVQVLYGNFFYTSSILIGTPWRSVILLLILAYYGYYYFSYKAAEGKGMAGCVMSVSVLLVLAIAFIFVNNMTLMEDPQRWTGMYRASPTGWNLNLGDHSLLPRYLHMVNGALVVFSAILAEFGLRKMKSEEGYGRWLLQRSSVVFAFCTGLQFLFGMWLLLAIPREIAMEVLRAPLTASVFGLALVSAIAAMLLILLGSMQARPSAMIHSGFAVSMVTLLLMIGLRFLLRIAYLKPYHSLGALHTSPQVGVIAMFLALFIGGLATVAYMLWLVVRSGRAGASEAMAD